MGAQRENTRDIVFQRVVVRALRVLGRPFDLKYCLRVRLPHTRHTLWPGSPSATHLSTQECVQKEVVTAPRMRADAMHAHSSCREPLPQAGRCPMSPVMTGTR